MKKSYLPTTQKKSSVRASNGFLEAIDNYSPEVDLETRRRIQLAMAAYAYEVNANPIMDDASFDKLAKQIDVSITTRRPDLDKFFKEEFRSYTGSWIWKHPDFDKIGNLVRSRNV